MTFDVLTTDWTIARKKMAAGWQPAERAADIFEGSAHCEIATIEGVALTRLCVRPRAKAPQAKAPKDKDELAKINKSLAVCFEADWQSQPIEKADLPFGMTWLQAEPGRFDFHFDMPVELRAHGLGRDFRISIYAAPGTPFVPPTILTTTSMPTLSISPFLFDFG